MSSVMTVRVEPVSRFLIATIAPPIAAPDASSTLPEIVAVTCACALPAPAASITIAITNPLNIRLVIAGLHPALYFYDRGRVYRIRYLFRRRSSCGSDGIQVYRWLAERSVSCT